MAKRRSSYKQSDRSDLEKDEDVVAEEEKPKYTSTRKPALRSRINARIRLDGPASGKHYEWSSAGSVVEVDEEDVSGLLAKRLGEKTCCGNTGENKLFELVE